MRPGAVTTFASGTVSWNTFCRDRAAPERRIGRIRNAIAVGVDKLKAGIGRGGQHALGAAGRRDRRRVSAAKAVVSRAAHRPVRVGCTGDPERDGIRRDGGGQIAGSGPPMGLTAEERHVGRDKAKGVVIAEGCGALGAVVAGLGDRQRIAIGVNGRVEQLDVVAKRGMRVHVIARHRARGDKAVRHLPGLVRLEPVIFEAFLGKNRRR